MSEKKDNHYIDNKEFYAALVIFNEARAKDPEYPVSNYIGKCLMDISYRIVYRPNFINYSYRDEMQEDALENCVKSVGSFDHTQYKNPFGYYSRIAWFACIRRIQKEQDQMDAKAGLVQSGMLYQDTIDHITSEENEYFDPEALSSLEYLFSYDIKHKIKKPKKEKPRTEFDITSFG